MKIKSIGDRITYSRKGKELLVIISAKVDGLKESLLAAWVFCWTIVGILLIWQLNVEQNTYETKWGILVLLIFWAYYEFRVGKTFLWRRFGKEVIKVSEGEISVKRDIRTYGKVHRFFIENISEFGVIDNSTTSFAFVLNQSFWVMGGERIGFNYQHRKVKMAMQINEQDSKALARLIQDALRENRSRTK